MPLSLSLFHLELVENDIEELDSYQTALDELIETASSSEETDDEL